MTWRRWFGGRLSRSARERDTAREIADHLELETEDQQDAGLTSDAARDAALRAFGNATLVREDIRAIHGTPTLDALALDLRYALRGLRRAPGFTIVAVGSSAIGIAAASIIFAMVNAAVLKPLPVADPTRLVSISEIDRRTGEAGNELSYFDYLDVQRANSFAGMAAVSPFIPASIDAHDDPQRHWGAIATANYFAVVQPSFAVGRGFDPARDNVPGQPAVVVLSHALWRGRFNGDPSIVGRDVAINGRTATIVGVTAAGFRGTESGVAPEFWIPFSMLDEVEARMGPVSKNRGRHWLDVLARLGPGIDAARAGAELDVIANRLNAEYLRGSMDRGFHLERAGQLPPALRGGASTMFALALALTALVVATGCVNVANLLLGRAAARGREIAARMALGATRGRLIRQLLTESLLLASLGGVGGWIIAAYVCPMIGFARAPLGWPLDFTVHLDTRVVLFCMALSTAIGVGFGLLPALKSTRPGQITSLRVDLRTASDRSRTRNILVVAQVAVCAVLLLCSGLALRSLYVARGIDLGFANRDILLVAFDPGLNHRPDEESRVLLRSLLDRVKGMPGVASATLTSAVPLTFIVDNSNFVWDLRAKDPRPPRVRTDIYRVGPGFFETFGIPVRSGSDFGDEPAATSLRRTIVNDAFARAAFQDESPLGRRILGDGKALDVAGVVSTAKSRTIGESARPAIYLPMFSEYVAGHASRGITLAVRTTGDPASMSTAVRDAIRAADPTLAVFDIRTMATHIGDAMILPRLMWGLAAAASGIGLTLAIIGLYAVVSFAVVRRRRELGIRLAVGAMPREILLMVLKQGLGLALIGTAIGVLTSAGVTRFASSLLYGIDPIDGVTFVAAPAVLLLVAAAACLIPARAAARLNPVEVLRAE